MADKYDERGRGALWKNEKKTNDKQPDFTGSYVDHDGVGWWLSGWKRKEGDGPRSPALKISTQRKDGKPRKGNDDMDNAVPF